MNNELIKRIYDSIINYVLSDIEEENKSEISDEYMKYLSRSYSNLNISEENFDKICDAFIKRETNRWKNRPENYKKSQLLKDENLNRIREISLTALDYAKKRLFDHTIQLEEVEAKGLIEQMEKCIKLVKPFNMNLAKTYISEGTIDLLYASGKTEYTSLRIGRMR